MGDLAYATHSFRLEGAALIARYVEDKLPPNGYLDLTNLESRKEGGLATRYGKSILTYDPVGTINTPCQATGFNLAQLHTLGRLKSLGSTHRYAISQQPNPTGGGQQKGGAIYRRDTDSPGQYSVIWKPTDNTLAQGPNVFLSGQRCSLAEYRPSLSSNPFLFIADKNLMLKDDGLGTSALPWGIPAPPLVPITNLQGAPGSGGPNTGSGQPYDYRYTWYDIATGTESTPSVVQISTAFLSPSNQPISVTRQGGPTSQQVTHWRIYRRGGTLNDFWYRVATVPLSAGQTYVDNSPDSGIQNNDTLGGTIPLNADPPCTTNLPQPVSGTATNHVPAGQNQLSIAPDTGASSTFYVGQLVTVGFPGVNQENVYVLSVPAGLANAFTASFQYAHGIGDPVYAPTRPATAMNLAAAAYNRMWLAGDPNNPHILYYSNLYAPESFSVQNFIEVGVPSEPITALLALNGVLYVFTTTTVWKIVAIGSAIPQPVPTGVKHGLAASFAWVATETLVFYLGIDGMYAFNGADAEYVSEPVEWLFQNKTFSPIAPLSLQPQNTSALTAPTMAFHQNEVYLAFTDINGARKRLVYHTIYHRWRLDDIQANALLFEKDTGNLLVTVNDDIGAVYQDRVGDIDFIGYPVVGKQIINPINFRLQTGQTDNGAAKAFKVYNEFTLDANTNGAQVATNFLTDNGLTDTPLAVAATGKRQQTQINLNNGLGVLSQNAGIAISGAAGTGGAVYLYEVHLRAILEAEYRRSFDTYWLEFDTAEFKISKQTWLTYTCQDPAGIAFSMYLDGSTVPAYTFSVPQSNNRTTIRVRFPAVLGRIWRLVGTTSGGDFQLYTEDNHLEVKTITGQKSYNKVKLMAGAA